MTNIDWSERELSLVRSDKSNAEIARLTGRTEGSIRAKRHRMGIGSPKNVPTAAETTVDEDTERARQSYWKEQHEALRKKYEQVLKRGAATERLIERVSSLAPLSYSPAPPIIARKPGKGKPQSAVLMLTDTHVGAVVSPRQTLGF